ncbi:histone-lysine N-methyltransferase NSD2 isoform X2 [Hetaerina americana]|uniref:histone-lysine N-methyltransferase NSD2 isoform X2 n=1 Tax=Hetaerina americana TaxID=62018 RepID=UPI003A7F2B80
MDMLKSPINSGYEETEKVISNSSKVESENDDELVSESTSNTEGDTVDKDFMNSKSKVLNPCENNIPEDSNIDNSEINSKDEATNILPNNSENESNVLTKDTEISDTGDEVADDLVVGSSPKSEISKEAFSKHLPPEIDKDIVSSAPTTPVVPEVSELPSSRITRLSVSPLECNGNSSEVNEDISIRSRYGRTHKPKPLTEGFLTTDKKVGALLGHSPQSSPRKKDESLRLSLKSFKKVSPVKISPGEKLKAALESIKKSIVSGSKTATPRRVLTKSYVENGGSPFRTPKSMDAVPIESEKSSTIPQKVGRTRGRPRISTDTVKKGCTYNLPSKRLSRSSNVVATSDKTTSNANDDLPARKQICHKNVDDSTVLKTTDAENCNAVDSEVVNIKEETSQSDTPVSNGEEMPMAIKQEFMEEDEEAMAEKESDSGVESSATAPPSEPEDGLHEGSKEVDPAVPPLSSSEWLVGDLVWSHIRGHPFWPSIVVHEPEQGIYIKNVGKMKMSHFHVRFFGDNARRSWIRSKQMISFNGSKDYLQLIEEHPNRKKDFEVSTRNIPKWKLAVLEAEELLDLRRAERLEIFSSKYSDALKEENKAEDKFERSKSSTPRVAVKKNRKRPRPLSMSLSSSENESPQKDGEKADQQEKSSRYRKKSRKIKPMMTPFDAFSEKYRDRVVDEFPDLENDGIESVLQQRWDMLDESIKSRYESQGNEAIQNGDKVSDDDEAASLEAETVDSVTSKDENLTKSEVKVKNRKLMSRVDIASKRKGLFRGLKPDKVCVQCEEPGGEVLKCRGPCFRFFHLKCAPEDSKGTDGSDEFRCGNCVSGEMAPCNSCWKKDQEKKEGERKRCNQHGCGRCYHEECLPEWPQAWWSRQTFTCPSHCCHTCASDDPRDARMHTSQAEKLVRCIRCPATYHSGDFCLPAGCQILTGSQIICQRHYKVPKKGAFHMNTSWCFICSMGGSLICCDRCPSSFHPQCLNITAPEGSYICEDCDSARYPLYGEVVWVKLGRYRWWPAKILYPSEIPKNVENLSHSLGEFAVRFFGSHDHYWVNNGRAFLYQDGDSAKIAAPKSGTDALFARALAEASISYKEHAKRKADWETANIAGRNNSSKPPRFVRIKMNKPVGDVKPFESVHASYTPCDCDPKTEKPCSQEPNCLNRMLMVECMPGLCRAGDRCGNQRFQKRQYPPLNTCRTEGRGWGLQTLADIAQGDFVVEYVGEMINEAECHRRIERMHRLKDENYYFLTIDKDHILDAGPKGNLSRFMNHSCNPNCETQKWTVGGETRVGLFALRDIPAGTELTFNYNLQVIGTDRRPCLCGASNCVRFIGAKVKSEQEESNSETTLALSSKKTKANGKVKKLEKSSKILANVCVTCGHGGELVYCSLKTCGKGYHSSCMEPVEEPKGKFLCPLHLCFICGLKATSYCGECSNLFCREHLNEKLSSKRGIVCSNHMKKEIVSEEVSLSEKNLDEANKGSLEDAVAEESKEGKAENVRISRRRSSAKGRLSMHNER